MDLKICGILDIVIILFGLISITIGYKMGFIKKVLSLAGFLVVLVLAFVYCKQLAQILIENEVIYPEIYNPILDGLLSKADGVGLDATATMNEFLRDYVGLPEFMADLFAKVLSVEGDVQTICIEISEYISNIAMNIISFLIIFVGSSVLILLLKLVANSLRKVKVVRVIDGVLGATLYFTIFILFVYVAFTFIQVFMDKAWFASAKDFLIIDMQLPVNGEETPFRLSRYLYDNNVLYKLIELFL
jgi:uncharacterized membrane protein required for colicin V production